MIHISQYVTGRHKFMWLCCTEFNGFNKATLHTNTQ